MWVLVPIFLCLVLVLTVGSLFAGVFWLLGSAWPWLLIGLGAWMFWHEDGRHRRPAHSRRGWWASAADLPRGGSSRPAPFASTPGSTSASASASAASASSKASARDSRSLRKPELPIDIQVKVEQIRRKVDVLLGYADRFPPFSQDLYLVRQTASDYLPRTVNAFLSLPADALDQPLRHASGGQTARQELRSQLDLLDSKLDDIAQDLQRQDADRLLANRRFLEARFGTREAASNNAPLSA